MALDPDNIPKWKNRPILAADHVDELEQESALREFRDRKPRQDAESGAHGDYVNRHHREAMAHHYRGMKAAQSLGQTKEGQKHGALYELHAKALGHDPYQELPPDVQKLVDGPDAKSMYRFKIHPADALLLKPGQNDNQEQMKVPNSWTDAVHETTASGPGYVDPQAGVLQFRPQSTKKSEEKPMADDKRAELMKKTEQTWAAVHAREDAEARKVETLTTLYKAAKLALSLQKGEESSTAGSHSESSTPVEKADVPPVADSAPFKKGLEGTSQEPAMTNPAASTMKAEDEADKISEKVKARQAEYDKRADKPHAFRAVDDSKFAPTKDKDDCAHCGESRGHKSHYNSYGQFHKSERDVRKAELEKKVRDQFKDRLYDQPSFVPENGKKIVEKGVADDSI